MTRFTCPECGSHVAKELVLCDGLMQDVEYSGGELRYSEPETMGDILEVSYSVVEIARIEMEERRERERWSSIGDRDYSGGGGSGFR